jgi:hypothetical protein
MSKKKYYIGDSDHVLEDVILWCQNLNMKISHDMVDVSDFSGTNDYVLTIMFDEEDTNDELLFVLRWVNGN